MVGQQILALPIGVRVPTPQSNCLVGHRFQEACPNFLEQLL